MMPSTIRRQLAVFALATLLAMSYGAAAGDQGDKKAILAVSGMT